AAAGTGGKGEALRATKVTGEDACIGFVKKKTSAVEKFHQRAGHGEAAFREQDEFAAALKIFGDAFDGVGRFGLNRKSVAVDHDETMDWGELGRLLGGDEFPVVVQAN